MTNEKVFSVKTVGLLPSVRRNQLLFLFPTDVPNFQHAPTCHKVSHYPTTTVFACATHSRYSSPHMPFRIRPPPKRAPLPSHPHKQASHSQITKPSFPKLSSHTVPAMGTEFSGDDDSSSAFSDCNSDRSGEFSTTSDSRRRLLIACATENSDELIRRLVSDLQSCSIETQRNAALEIRLLAKEDKKENRLKIARAGAIKPLVSILHSHDSQLQEYGVTAILNLSLCDENKDLITASGAIKPLIRALKIGSSTTKENAAVALLRLSQIDENKITIGSAGAIAPLVDLLEHGSLRGKKDAAGALYLLSSVRENKVRAIQAGIMKPLVELMADLGTGMVDKAAYVVMNLVSLPEGKKALVAEGGIPVLVEILEVGSRRQKETAADILLQICEDSSKYRTMVVREGAVPPLVALSQSGTSRAKQKAETLIQLLRRPLDVSD